MPPRDWICKTKSIPETHHRGAPYNGPPIGPRGGITPETRLRLPADIS
jgi:hypothetical protein